MLYKICDLQRIHGQRRILDINELQIESGRVYSLTGPNGAGKTTLLNILAFLDRPDCGELYFQDYLVPKNENSLRQLRRKVVLVDQYPILFTGSVWKNIDFGLRIRKIPRAIRQARIKEVLTMVGMHDFAHADAHKLSGGETKRIALARAIALEPEVLLCDEPTANVDVENQEIILRILERSNKENGLSLIFATHYLSQAQRIADKTIMLQNGMLSDMAQNNTFGAKITGCNEKSIVWRIDGKLPLVFPNSGQIDAIDAIKAYIDPAKIEVLATDTDMSDKDNYWTGSICKIERENGGVRITVDVGLHLDLFLEKEKYYTHRYSIDEAVILHIREESVTFLAS